MTGGAKQKEKQSSMTEPLELMDMFTSVLPNVVVITDDIMGHLKCGDCNCGTKFLKLKSHMLLVTAVDLQNPQIINPDFTALSQGHISDALRSDVYIVI